MARESVYAGASGASRREGVAQLGGAGLRADCRRDLHVAISDMVWLLIGPRLVRLVLKSVCRHPIIGGDGGGGGFEAPSLCHSVSAVDHDGFFWCVEDSRGCELGWWLTLVHV